ncbi:MAG: hypothetical protein NTW52_16835 [Planctomycetota bacterium]|nr:hypothetical protein [Planctomycetota bacterium]
MVLAVALAAPTVSLAQSPGGWSPEPFVAPNANQYFANPTIDAQSAAVIPQNRLRGEMNQASINGLQSGSSEPVVARWRSTRSTPETNSNQTGSNQIAYAQAANHGNVFSQSPNVTTAYAATGSIPGPVFTNRQHAQATSQSVSRPTTHATSYPTGTSTGRSIVSHEPIDTNFDSAPRVIRKNRQPITQEVQQASTWSNRPTETENSFAQQQRSQVQVAAYQANVQTQEAPALNEPGFAIPSLSESPQPSPLDAFPPFQSNGTPSEQAIDPLPPEANAPTTRSLIEPKNTQPAPSPFLPPSNTPPGGFRNESPSDQQMELDRLPPKSKGSKRFDVDCDDVRGRAMSTDIATIKLNVAPEFGVGPKDKLSTEQKQSKFALTAPLRPWYDASGRPLADGRLVDLEYDSIIIESSTGERLALSIRELSDADTIYVSESWGLPVTCSLGDQTLAARSFEPTTVAWKASGLCHKPLYFEEIQLERSGHEWGPAIQPVLSTAHFFTNVAFLPYKMAINPMNECQYALGHYRPGSCAPWSIEPIPLSLKGLAAQGATIGGAVMILP